MQMTNKGASKIFRRSILKLWKKVFESKTKIVFGASQARMSVAVGNKSLPQEDVEKDVFL